jgi:hypothetical protein
MEELVLNTLQFNFYLPTGGFPAALFFSPHCLVVDFLGVFLTVIPEIVNSSPAQMSLCMVTLLFLSHRSLISPQYLGELSIYYALTCRYTPSVIATAIISYALTFTPAGGSTRTSGVEWVSNLHTLANLF